MQRLLWNYQRFALQSNKPFWSMVDIALWHHWVWVNPSVYTIEIEPGERWARPPSVSSVEAAYQYRAIRAYGKIIILWHARMAKWQDVSAHRPFLVFSLVNDDVIVWQNCMAKCILPYTRYENGVCASIKMVSQRNHTHNETLSVLRVLFLWYTPKANQCSPSVDVHNISERLMTVMPLKPSTNETLKILLVYRLMNHILG